MTHRTKTVNKVLATSDEERVFAVAARFMLWQVCSHICFVKTRG